MPKLLKPCQSLLVTMAGAIGARKANLDPALTIVILKHYSGSVNLDLF